MRNGWAACWRSAALAAVLVLVGLAPRADAATITLRDGSTISGEVVSLSNGVYTIRSATLGTVTVRQDDVRSLTEQPSAPRAAQLDSVREHIAADPAAMDAITALAADPDIQAILNDPDLLAALRDGNLEALLSNPKVARLAADPRMQSITNRIAGGLATGAGAPPP